jgi:hypothetical protein
MKNKIVAKAVGAEFDDKTDEVFIKFKVIDQDFKKTIKTNWLEDSELLLVLKNGDSYEIL